MKFLARDFLTFQTSYVAESHGESSRYQALAVYRTIIENIADYFLKLASNRLFYESKFLVLTIDLSDLAGFFVGIEKLCALSVTRYEGKLVVRCFHEVRIGEYDYRVDALRQHSCLMFYYSLHRIDVQNDYEKTLLYFCNSKRSTKFIYRYSNWGYVGLSWRSLIVQWFFSFYDWSLFYLHTVSTHFVAVSTDKW